MNGRSLRALINQTEVGTLQEVGGLWSFRYTEDWLNDGKRFALSPHIPLTTQPLAEQPGHQPPSQHNDQGWTRGQEKATASRGITA